jgi:4-hydroxybenzoate polyprenyltransferase
MPIIRLLRQHQWIKNVFLFAPFLFSFNTSWLNFLTLLLGFFYFSLAASAIYILNDYKDIAEDQAHPTKCFRPLASGAVTKKSGLFLMITLLGLALLGSFFLSSSFMMVISAYLLMNIAYSLGLKHITILDISLIAIGFVLRIFAGSVLIELEPSIWITVLTFLLALFLALAKRRDDCLLASMNLKTRKNIDGYNLEMISAAMTMMGSVTIVAYLMYTISPDVIRRLGTDRLYLTTFFVIVGILRYFQLTFVEENSGSPTNIVLKDRFLQCILVGWLLSFYAIVLLGS